MIYTHLAAFLAGSIIAGSAAWKTQQWRHDAAQLEALEQARETEVMRRKAANQGAAQHEREKIVIREKFVLVIQEVERIVTQVEYRDRQCFTDDGLRLVNDAIRSTRDSRESGDAVPAAKPVD